MAQILVTTLKLSNLQVKHVKNNQLQCTLCLTYLTNYFIVWLLKIYEQLCLLISFCYDHSYKETFTVQNLTLIKMYILIRHGILI